MPEVNRETGVKMAFIVFAGMGLFLLVQKWSDLDQVQAVGDPNSIAIP